METHLVSIKDIPDLLKDTYRRWRDIRPELLAGGLAYFAILSATPLLVILIGLLRLVVAKARVMAQLDAVLSPSVGGLVREWLLPAHGSGLATLTIFSVVVLLYSASQVFVQLRVSLDVIWDVPVKTRPSWHGFFKTTAAPLVMILATGLLVLTFILLDAGIGIASRMSGTALPGLGRAALWKTASLTCSLALFTLFFGGIFKLVPSRKLRWRDVWAGAALTSGLFALVKYVLTLYFSWLSFDSLYGATGSLIVIMIWVYASAQIFFFGAVFISVYSKKRGAEIR
jgi:membrane protein